MLCLDDWLTVHHLRAWCLRRPETVPFLDLSYRWLWATIRALETEPRVLWRVVTSILNLWDIISSFNVSESLILKLSFWLELQFKKKIIKLNCGLVLVLNFQQFPKCPHIHFAVHLYKAAFLAPTIIKSNYQLQKSLKMLYKLQSQTLRCLNFM